MTDNVSIIIVGLVSILVFILAFRYSKLVSLAKNTMAETGKATSMLRDASIDDEEKERAVQRASLFLLKQSLLIISWSALVLAAPVAVIWLGDVVGIARHSDVSDFLLSWQVLFGTSVIALMLFIPHKRK